MIFLHLKLNPSVCSHASIFGNRTPILNVDNALLVTTSKMSGNHVPVSEKKMENKPTTRLLCNRLREGFLDWPRFTESDVNERNAATSCARIPTSRTSTHFSTSGSSSESDTTAQKGKVSSCSTRTYRQRKTTIRRKEEKIDSQNQKIDDLSNKIAVLEESEKS